MPKAAAPGSTTPSAEKTISKAQFLKALDKKAAVARTAATAERKTGFATDHDTLAKLEIPPGESKTFPAKVSRILFSFAKDDANRPAFRFNYGIVSDNPKYNGTIVGNYMILEEGKDKKGEIFRTEEQAQEQVFGEFQGLGEDTAAWTKNPRVNPLALAVEAAEQHTKEKTDISVNVRHWVSRDGKSSGMNVFVKGLLANDNSDLEATEPEETDEATEADPLDWIDCVVSFISTVDNESVVRAKVTAYNADNDNFDLIDENNEIWDGDYAIPADSMTYLDDQTWA